MPANAVLVPWLSYAQTMPACDLVVCHGGHGTLLRALTSGCPVVVCPAGGDMAENAARIDWAGLGVRLPQRFCTPWGVRLAVTPRARPARVCARGRGPSPRWAAAHPGPAAAALELERWAETARHSATARGHAAPRAAERKRSRREAAPDKLGGWDSNPQPFG